ncbi:MAG: ABC transporter permease [Cryomorphaceae bacterium]|nr:ABC transporter permease [Cryomorphaceae bacterium]MBT3503942.1 ABC transporter permease [Cryomorphaceae bacterium]MBT3688624.1 ABC transporter permease [Cryomorphaceae bacterium]MBT4222287.1 ABC transporter permease [Cryomorphaceae bacterium]MBT4294110.1 ABC transporter permease [Cryomorphaceae bacterium]
MNLPFFIYRKLRTSNDKSNISSRIIKIAVISVFLGVFVSLSAISIGKGLQLAIKDKLYSLSPDIVVSTYENNSRGIASEKINNFEFIESEIKAAFPSLQFENIIEKPTLISNNNSFETVIFRGVSDGYNFDDFNKFIIGPKIIDIITNQEIIISKSLSDKLEILVGHNLTLYFKVNNNQRIPNLRSYTVKHVFDTDFPDFDSNYIIGNLGTLQNIYKWDTNDFANIEISVDDKSKIFEIEKSMSSLKSFEKNNLSIKTIQSKYDNIFSWISIFDFNIFIINSLMIIVAIISVIISLFILIFERIKMIGILSSMGSTNKSLSKIFLYQGFEIILKGMLPANILFLTISIIQNSYGLIKLNPDDYYVESIPFILDPLYIISLNLIFILISSIILSITFVSITRFTPKLNINS